MTELSFDLNYKGIDIGLIDPFLPISFLFRAKLGNITILKAVDKINFWYIGVSYIDTVFKFAIDDKRLLNVIQLFQK